MNLARARSLSLVVALMSCSTDTLVVATLDASGGEGGEPGVAQGGGGGDPLGGGGDPLGGGGDQLPRGGGALGGSETASNGGTTLITGLEGEATTNVCACIGSASFVCGADGVTYDPSCAGGCEQIVIACLHACPCSDDTASGGAPSSTEWVDQRCFNPSLCPRGHFCFTSDGTGLSSPCAP